MKYGFETPAPFKQKIVIDRALINGKVKVIVDGKPISPSHRGQRGATGTFYQVRGGVIEVRSGLLDIVPMVWYNEEWVQLAPPMRPWEWVIAGMPLLPGALALGLDSLIIGFLAMFVNLIIMRSNRPTGLKVALNMLVFTLTWVLIAAVRIGINLLTGQGQAQ